MIGLDLVCAAATSTIPDSDSSVIYLPYQCIRKARAQSFQVLEAFKNPVKEENLSYDAAMVPCSEASHFSS
ncbi:hypothetical protein N7468_010428 [Penicillium chermesinum]|uniref:Uncharacterized protein n=1 Tax=Penicillium chermesinum TaxID=63820 RepID=A0A9W9NCN4_9EURO|nr:uncharacterized protein N7468_010428 [Penicillium chermesinum]KAJ5217420.1 hypothetical protein N7468_010428 [Penicillium chermesinum]